MLPVGFYYVTLFVRRRSLDVDVRSIDLGCRLEKMSLAKQEIEVNNEVSLLFFIC